jgi:hypothetical protein
MAVGPLLTQADVRWVGISQCSGTTCYCLGQGPRYPRDRRVRRRLEYWTQFIYPNRIAMMDD